MKDGVKQFADAADKLYGAVAHKRAAVLGGSIDRQTLALGAGIEKARREERRGTAGEREGSPGLAADKSVWTRRRREQMGLGLATSAHAVDIDDY